MGVAVVLVCAFGGIYLAARHAANARLREQSQRNTCMNNLRMIDQVKDQAALKSNYGMDAAITPEEISPYLKYGYASLVCPKGGEYVINAVGRGAECSEHGSVSKMLSAPIQAASGETQRAAAARAEAMKEEAIREAMRVDGVSAAAQEEARAAEQARLEEEQQAQVEAEARAARTERPAEPLPMITYKLSGLMSANGKGTAIINGKTMIVGDRLGAGQILSIGSSTVTIELANGDVEALHSGEQIAIQAVRNVVLPLPENLRDGLVAYYPFDGNEGDRISDHSGSRRHASAKNVSWTAAGKVRGAIRFAPAGSYILASDSGLPAGDTPRSIAFWKKTGPDNEPCNSLLAYGSRARGQQFSMGMDWRVGRSSIAVSPYGSCNVAAKKLGNERWYHIVYCYGGAGKHTIYIDGVADSFSVREFSRYSTQLSGELFLGDSDRQGPSYDGCIDEVMIYDRILSPVEVRQIYERR